MHCGHLTFPILALALVAAGEPAGRVRKETTSGPTGASAAAGLAETARFLAGKGVAASDSDLAEHARTESYAEYAEASRRGQTSAIS
jgi:hypothetical protein